MKITLLTHEKELTRPDNSGRLCLGLEGLEIERIVWRRKEPEQQLLTAFNNDALLITPHGDGQQMLQLDHSEHLVLLDGTWQEAKKMYNRSSYLKAANWFALPEQPESKFNLRRNQIPGGLCTAECVISILNLKQMAKQAATLQQRFERFIAN